MRCSVTLAVLALLPLVAGLNLEIYSDGACSQGAVLLSVYNGYCVTSPMLAALGATCSSDSTVKFTAFSSANACSGTVSAGPLTVTTTCTTITGVTGYQSAKIVGGTCTAPGKVYTTTLYSDAGCTTQTLAFPVAAGNVCVPNGFQWGLASQAQEQTGNTIDLNVWGVASSCAGPASMTFTGISSQGTCYPTPSIGGSLKMTAAPAFSGASATTLVASAGALLLSAIVAIATQF